jgi:hypothetical protein
MERIEEKISSTVRLVKALIPQINDALQSMNTNNGWLQMDDEFISAINNLYITDWAKYYEDETKLKTISMLASLGEDGILELRGDQNAKEDLKVEFAEFLEDGDFVPPTEADIEQFKSQYSTASEEEQQKITRQVAFIYLGFITSIFNYLALMVHGRTMCQLVTAAMSGDDDAYRRAVQIDRTTLYLPYFKERMLKAQFSDDERFLTAVANSLKRPILSTKIRHRTLRLVFAILEDEGLLGLPHERLLDICEQVGVYGKQHGVEDVGHLRKRLSDYRRSQRTPNIF